MTLDHRTGLGIVPTLERELAEARADLANRVDRADALAQMYEIAVRVQDAQERPIDMADVRVACAVKGEQARAELLALERRILEDPRWEG